MAKTKKIYVLKSNYGYGWEDEIEYEADQYNEAIEDLKTYKENCPNNQFKIITRRVKI